MSKRNEAERQRALAHEARSKDLGAEHGDKRAAPIGRETGNSSQGVRMTAYSDCGPYSRARGWGAAYGAPSLALTMRCTGQVAPTSNRAQTDWQAFGDRWLSLAVLKIRLRGGWEVEAADSNGTDPRGRLNLHAVA